MLENFVDGIRSMRSLKLLGLSLDGTKYLKEIPFLKNHNQSPITQNSTFPNQSATIKITKSI
jgi:hypothetical protein